MSSFLKRWRRKHDKTLASKGNAPTGGYVVSAYCGRYGGTARIRRANKSCFADEWTPRVDRQIDQAAIRGVSYDKRRAHRLPPMRSSTGLIAR